MLSVLESLKICEAAFPRGPEALAETIGAIVEYDSLDGCDGWCVHGEFAIVVRINHNVPVVRQRFTLAHELAHLLLASAPDVEVLAEFGYPHGASEQIVDRVAAEMLLPSAILRRLVTSVPIKGVELRRIAEQADVSEMVVAQRVVTSKEELHIDAAFMADFKGIRVRIVPLGACPPWRARILLQEAQKRHPEDYVYELNGCLNVATAFETPYSTSMLVQSVRQQ